MAGPIIDALLMTTAPDAERSTASAAQSLTSTLVATAAAALAGFTVAHYGYSSLFYALALIALGAGMETAQSAGAEHGRKTHARQSEQRKRP